MRVDREFVFAAVADERRKIADLVDGLDDRQLSTPSLCAGLGRQDRGRAPGQRFRRQLLGVMGTALRRGSMARAIDELARQRAKLPAVEITATLRQRADHPLSPPLFGPLDPLADILVHGGDVRTPLNLPFEPDPERAALALDFLTGPWPFGFVPLGRLRGLSLHGTDVDRTWGKGPEIRGPAAALMMVATGRIALLHTLDGPGLPLLEGRLGS